MGEGECVHPCVQRNASVGQRWVREKNMDQCEVVGSNMVAVPTVFCRRDEGTVRLRLQLVKGTAFLCLLTVRCSALATFPLRAVRPTNAVGPFAGGLGWRGMKESAGDCLKRVNTLLDQ